MLQGAKKRAERIGAAETDKGNGKGAGNDKPAVENARSEQRRMSCHNKLPEWRYHLAGGVPPDCNYLVGQCRAWRANTTENAKCASLRGARALPSPCARRILSLPKGLAPTRK